MTEELLSDSLRSMATGAILSLLPHTNGGAALAQVRKMANGWLTTDNRTFSGADAPAQCAAFLTTQFPDALGIGIYKVM